MDDGRLTDGIEKSDVCSDMLAWRLFIFIVTPCSSDYDMAVCALFSMSFPGTDMTPGQASRDGLKKWRLEGGM